MKKIIPILVLSALLASCSHEKKMLRHASTAVDRSEFERALGYYDQILYKNENSYFGNAGKGIVLSEFMGRHEQAIPYLEKSLANSPPEKSKPVVHGNLARSYHFIGNFKRALEYYNKLDNDPSYSDYDAFLTKRIADCKYALDHPEIAPQENQSIVNLGKTINTDKPEYTPVYANGKLYFTSKRKDNEKEKKNGLDGKYFESVYVAELNDGSWTDPQKLELGETPGLRSGRSGEAVASASPDGKNLYIYKGGMIYQTAIEDKSHEMKALEDAINFAKLQNHAAVSPDGNTMYFTTEADGGNGTDIYYATKQADGSWGKAKALDFTVNTPYNEEAPFITADGILFFSSNGHPGYGGFDVYRTQQVNGQWTQPVNLGQPVNSPGDDIFFTLLPESSRGYFSSARPGGHGDLDIYKIHYLNTDAPACAPAEDILAINTEQDPNNPLAYNISLSVPEAQKEDVRSYAWMINGKAIPETKESFRHSFNRPDHYIVTAKIVTACDSCPALSGLCVEKTIDVQNEILAARGDIKEENKGAFAKNSRYNNKKTDAAKNRAAKNKTSDAATTEKDSRTATASNKNKRTGTSEMSAYLSEESLTELNWNTQALRFEYDQTTLTENARAVLDANTEILKNNAQLLVDIVGHADSRGSAAYNKTLSEKRAAAVKQYLISKGADADQIRKVSGKGEDQLLNECTDEIVCDESRHEENRRVQIKVSGEVNEAGQFSQN